MRGDEIFEAEHLPSYAKTYILPKQMIRKKSHSEVDVLSRKNSHDSVGPLSRKTSLVDNNTRKDSKQSIVNADFQFSMLKASLDYDTEIFGTNTSQKVIENNPLSRNYSTVSSVVSEEDHTVNNRKKVLNRRESLQSCNAPGGMLEYSKYVQEGGFVPESIRNSEVGLDLEIFNVKASDIQERMCSFQEANFYDGTLNTNLTLQQAHTNLTVMMKEMESRADTARGLPGSTYSVGGGGGGGGSGTLAERRRGGRRMRGRAGSQSSSLMKDMRALSSGSSSNSSGYGSGMGMIVEEGQEPIDFLSMFEPEQKPNKTGSSSLMDMFGVGGDTSGVNNVEVENDEDSEVQIQGVGAVDMFIDEANPLNKAVHAALPTVVKQLEQLQNNRGEGSYLKRVKPLFHNNNTFDVNKYLLNLFQKYESHLIFRC